MELYSILAFFFQTYSRYTHLRLQDLHPWSLFDVPLLEVGILFPTCNSNPTKLQLGQVAYTYITNANIPEWFGFTEASSTSDVLSPVQPHLQFSSYSFFVSPAHQVYQDSNLRMARVAHGFFPFLHFTVYPRFHETQNDSPRSFSSQPILQQTPSSALPLPKYCL
ncbi:uncharacterized protein RSE6_11344 [Rhynchosporium secalis]|uniref:Uncharacterized protein n=1 Tax=Rhynchosporium secalis TaxID=38038 RepID=A0A1E1MMQ5_RHYSE|nr:uncharacterized protein RSE6_11344 [Rhynchosporium secalis]